MKSIDKAVENHRDLILEAERYIWKHPETGYREYGTTKYLAEKFEALGYELTYADAIPESVTIESYVRGKTFEAILKANRKINRALCGAALSIGANIEIVDAPGYAPCIHNEKYQKLSKEAADAIIPEEKFFIDSGVSTGSTDAGDLSCVIPVIQPYMGGATGISHGADYCIADPVRACVKSAKLQLAILKLLLKNNGERAKEIISSYEPLFNSKEEYFEYIDNIFSDGDRITYGDNGVAEVRI